MESARDKYTSEMSGLSQRRTDRSDYHTRAG